MPFFYFDPAYMLAIAPAMLLAMWAQWRVHATFAAASQEPAPLSGAAAARHILDSAGATEVAVEQVPGTLTDHYDPRTKVLRLSDAVYSSRSLAAVGIAAHEAGHALQDHTGYPLMSLRNAAVGIANIVAFGFVLGVADGVFVPAGAVALVVVLLPLPQIPEVQPLLGHGQRACRAVRHIAHPAWSYQQIAARADEHARALEITAGIVHQAMGELAAE